MNLEYGFETKKINDILNNDLNFNNKCFLNFVEDKINDFLFSIKRKDMLLGEDYYAGRHKILKRERTVIGEDGMIKSIKNLPNNKIIDNQYARMVDQKNSYLLSKPLTFYCENEKFLFKIRNILGKDFFRLIKNIGEDALNCGIAWLYLYINEEGNLDFKRFKPFEVLPFWEDEEHFKLKMLARIYNIEKFEINKKAILTRVEIYTKHGINYYLLKNGKLFLDYDNPFIPYIIDYNNTPMHWNKIPIIPFKYNSKEIPLIKKVKHLQDALNTVRSDFMNNIQEDARNTILVLKNYDGTNLSEFRKNLSEYGVVKVKTVDGIEGDIKTLKVEIDNSNYELIAKALKKAIVENARGYDCKEEKANVSLNQMNIQSIYLDIDLDASLMETEFQASFEILFYFIKLFIKNTFDETYTFENVEVIFNKDILINETEAINNCLNSKDLLSLETIISQHPWVNHVDKELKKIKKQNQNI